MSWFLSRPRQRTMPPARRPVQLSLEFLETRDCPSGNPVTPPPLSGGANPPPPVVNPAPTIQMMVTYGAQRTITLTGRVFDLNPGGLTVNFTGVVNSSAVTGPDGSFSLTTQASTLGTVEAVTKNAQGVASDKVTVLIVSGTPTISNFAAAQGFENQWTFTGKVTDESADGLVVSLGGLDSLQGQTIAVGADGWFRITIQLQEGETGVATALTTDWWGLTSQEAWCLV